MIWAFLYHMKMVSARLKILTLKVRVIRSLMTGFNPDEKWMHGDWFYTRDYSIFGREVKATESSPPDNLTG